ncbi:MAG TPA: histidinol-phosphate transaminase [Phycisphaerae bacterium]|nr:histidinol-phosphate transaminase [Phycisphaerae bacterium]HPS53330.1 histidinol-phosphate transaminase [Phycisphaerae bacterium]
MKYIKQNISDMQAYVPGEQPRELHSVIKLNTNENPYPPSPRITEFLRSFDAERLRNYPDPAGREFCETAAELFDVPPAWVQIGNGSDNLLVMLARACRGPVVVPTPTFPFYETQAIIENDGLKTVPFDEDFNLPVQNLIRAGGAVTYVANPASPTGGAVSVEVLAEMAASLHNSGLLVIDEAYADFAGFTAVPLVKEYDNVLVIRTLSKGYSLAGLRLGFAVSQPEILRELWKTKEIYNVGVLPLEIGRIALQDQEWKNQNVQKILNSRKDVSAELKARSWRVYPSMANFVFAAPADGNSAAEYENLKEKGIFVRYFEKPGMLRITMGRPEENWTMLESLRQI